MINRIIEFSAGNRFLVLLLVAAAAAFGWWSMRRVPLDAIPDLSDTQVIVYSRWDRSPDIVEDQVTYPIVTAMLGAPKVKAVRGFSDFGYSYVYVIFEDGTDIYWARSRTLEYLSSVLPKLPEEVSTELGPDATGLGWIFQYVLADTSGKHTLAELRSSQDWYLRYHLKSVPGVAEVAPLGGFTQTYQVNVDPNRLLSYGIPISRVVEAVRGGNSEVGGRLIEFGGTEYMVRGRGYARLHPRDRGNRRRRQRKRHADPHQGHRAGCPWPRPAARRLRSGRRGRSRFRHHRDAAGRERARRHPRRQSEAASDRAGPPRRRQDRPHLRPLRVDRALHRQSSFHAAGGNRHGRGRLSCCFSGMCRARSSPSLRFRSRC